MKNILRKTFVTLALGAVTTNAQKVTTIQQIDFDNFRYSWSNPPEGVPVTWHWLDSAPDLYFTTVNGMHHFYVPGQDKEERRFAPLISVDSVTYGDLDEDGVDEALVALNYSTGGTANWDYLYVYKLHHGRANLLARMQTGSRGDGGLIRAFVRDGVLVSRLRGLRKARG